MKKILKAAAAAGGALCLVCGIDNRLETTFYTVSSKKIPPQFSGFKIAHISDVHSDSVSGLIPKIREISPNIIVSTGDLTHDKGSYFPALRLCERLISVAPVYAVTGNHDLWRSDYEEFEKDIARVGVKTLHNERVILKKGGAEISLSGIDDPFTRSSAKASEAVKKCLFELGGYDGYDILLFHRANLFDCVKDRGFDLILSGHMHGGQLRLPGGRGIVAPKSGWTSSSVFFPKYTSGRYASEGSEMLVSRGIGNPMVIPRLFNRPELAVITLKHANQSIN